MPFGSKAWVRLVFAPATGELSVDGDLFSVLGVNSEDLSYSSDPFSMLPDSVARGLIEGKEITRDDKLSLVIIPGNTGHCNTVVVIAEQIADFDLVSDVAGGVVGFSPDGTILRWNKRMTYLFGPSEKDVTGRNAADVLPEPVLYNWQTVISSAHLGHEVRIEFRPSGEKRVEGVLSRGGPGVIGLFRDSTENYKTDKRLRALNRLNQAYLQSTGTGLLLLDSRLRVLLSNTGFSKVSGNRGSVIGLLLHDVLSEDSYKWVHDASEHLFAEERTEQSGIVAFKNRDGRQVVLRQTLRAVRNEANQAVNFVCLLEDETDLTLFRNEVENLNRSLDGLSRMSSMLLDSNQGQTDSFCEDILRVTRSRAVAQYAYDAFETMKLTGSAGEWPAGFPVEEPGEYNFSSFVWSGDKHNRISSVELGRLSGFFSSCFVIPTGVGISNRGYLVLAESALTPGDLGILNAVSSLAKLQRDIIDERIGRSSMDNCLEGKEGFADSLFIQVSMPMAIIRGNERVDRWNPAMEYVTGVKAENADSDDVRRLIDPEGSGLTLDSLASRSGLVENNNTAYWAVPRPDGSLSSVHLWNVSIIDSSYSIYGDSEFFIIGVPCSDRILPPAEEQSAVSIKRLIFDELTEMLSAPSLIIILRSFSNLCFFLGGKGVMEFRSEDELVATFPEGSKVNEHNHWNFRVVKFFMGKEFTINVSGEMEQETVDVVSGILSLRDQPAHDMTGFMGISGEIQGYSSGLSGYLEKFSSDSIVQNNAMLNMVEGKDPLAGFARTMLFAHETASRVSHLLRLTLLVKPDGFKVECPNRFLARLHSMFAQRGLRPPSLSFKDNMPDIVIIPEVLLQCFGMLCQLASPDSVVSFVAGSVDIEDRQGMHLVLTGLNEYFQPLSHEEISQRLESGRFDVETEVAILFRLMNSSGCSLLSIREGEIEFHLLLSE